jgi:transcriptional regulator with XRE-family HTH domain
MHNVCMVRKVSLTDIALAKHKLEELGLSQFALAKALRCSQSQVSRVLSGRTSSASKLAIDLCNYASILAPRVERSGVIANDDLINALTAVWDGTPAHARALAVVIRSLGTLSSHSSQQDAK